MRFSGIQKVSLLDYPGKLCCTVFTSGCNFRCPFCHNASLALGQEETIPAEDVLRYLEKRRGVLDGVTVTGGEPLLHAELPTFLEQVKALGLLVKLDTNGSRPTFLQELTAQGLVDRVAMDIKNSPECYAQTVGLTQIDLGPLRESRDFLLSGAVDYEFRTTVVRGLHTARSLAGAAKWIAGAKEYYLQGFVNRDGVLNAHGLEAFTPEEMQQLLQVVKKEIPNAALRGV